MEYKPTGHLWPWQVATATSKQPVSRGRVPSRASSYRAFCEGKAFFRTNVETGIRRVASWL
jgi:hypothetical protein